MSPCLSTSSVTTVLTVTHTVRIPEFKLKLLIASRGCELQFRIHTALGAPLPWVPVVSAEMSTDTWSSRQEELLKKQERLRQEQQELEQQRSAMLEKEKADKVRQQNLRAALRYTCDAGYTHDAEYARYSDGSRMSEGYRLRPPRQYPEARWYISPFCPYRTHSPAGQPQVLIEDAAYEITFTIPGLRKEDLMITVEGGALYFVGQTTTDDFDVGISRAVRLPADADLASAINVTTHADGIIKTRVPRVNLQAQPKQPSEPIHPTEPTSGAASAAAEPMQDWGAVAVALNAAGTAAPSGDGSTAWSKGDVGWSTWDVPRLRPLRDFTQEPLQQHIVSKVEQAGGYKIFIPSPGVQKTHTYRIEAYKSITYKRVQDFEARARGNTFVDMTPSGFLFVDSGPAIELYGADYTSPNVRITHQDGFVIVFIPLKESGTALPSGPDLVSAPAAPAAAGVGFFGAAATPAAGVRAGSGGPFGATAAPAAPAAGVSPFGATGAFNFGATGALPVAAPVAAAVAPFAAVAAAVALPVAAVAPFAAFSP